MANISLNGEDIFLKRGKSYFIIDALYLNEIRSEIGNVSVDNFEKEIKERVFPYTETPFAVVSFDNTGDVLRKVEISKIKKVGDEDIDIRCFSTDTGLIIVIERSIFLDFLNDFEYDKIVEGIKEPLNIPYWNEKVKKYDAYSCGLILAPGIKSGFDFDGSGLYKIEV